LLNFIFESKFVDAIFLKIGKKMNHPSNENLSIKQPKIEEKKLFSVLFD
jgi:hypothetical protein